MITQEKEIASMKNLKILFTLILLLCSISVAQAKTTKNKPDNLYKILESIYLLDKNKVYLGYKMFSKICKPINKKNLNKLLIDNNDDNLSYTCFKNTHIINDFLNNESTKLVIGSSHIKVKSNSMYPSLFNTLKGIPYLFVCDFQNMDYFYLKSIMFSR